MKITRMNPYEGSTKTKAFFDMETQEGFIIKGFTLVEGSHGLFVSPPREKGKDGNYYDQVVIPQNIKNELNEMALQKYDELKAQTV